MPKEDKTNVMRLLAAARVPFTEHAYDPAVTDGEEVARLVGTPLAETFKTLVTVASSRKNYVFVIPVIKKLDRKAAARAVGEKSIDMLPQKQLLPLTGYVHGGCSPVGMKKRFVTVFDVSCLAFEEITLSAGKCGRQVTVSPRALIDLLGAMTAPVAVDKDDTD